ncbi:Fic family protein [Acholeplasma equirhinis]|uniref:Fic family protein n=1 Tax=Acholeplasma equirhinis TaxID=555393 RepID=UPI00197A86C1|nr:Fic family protein [Acholeplasma equirhinis]MBN3490716.1 Fic family protein [Acholeplasma equirhinis]
MNHDLLEVDRLHFNELRESVGEEKFNRLLNEFVKKFVYESITIDGKNALSFEDCSNLLEKKVIVTSLPEREQKEALNYLNAFSHVFKLCVSRRRLDEEILKDLHEMLVEGIFVGGHYRKVNIQLPGSMHQPPDYVKVYDRMAKFFYDLEHFKGTALQKGAFAHATIFKIYPFLEGNGRLARLVLNYILIFDGYMPFSIPVDQKDLYLQHLDTFKVEKDISPFVNYIYTLLLDSYEKYIDYLEN